MIIVICKENKILYSAYHLVKAFWPDAQVQSAVEEGLETGIVVKGLPAGQTADFAADPGKYRTADTSTAGPGEIAGVRISAADVSSLYMQLRDLTGTELPWGMLTGVRPVKLASGWIEKHLPGSSPSDDPILEKSRDAFCEWFRKDRFVSREKAVLAFQVGMKEKRILESLQDTVDPEKGYSLYIGIPFCPSICSYCSFSSGSIVRYAGKVDAYLQALYSEMEQKARTYMYGDSPENPEQDRHAGAAGQPVYPTTVYIGGGTPTSLDADRLQELLDHVERFFSVRQGIREGKIKEYTVEAGRADSITAEKLAIIKEHGVTRISVNPQTMQQKTLDAVGRKHTVEDVRKVMHLARQMGFDNINMDLIMGLPGETNADVRDTLWQICELAPDSLTVHSLAVKRSSAIGIARKKGQDTVRQTATAGESGISSASGGSVQEQTDTFDIAEMIEDGHRAAAQMGMEPYYLYRQKSIAGNFENTGYALPGKEGLYNILIMEEVQSIIGCGAGASTKTVLREQAANPERGGKNTLLIRNENVKDIDEYIKRNTTV